MNVTKHQVACLQAMGIAVYVQKDAHDDDGFDKPIPDFPWLNHLLEFQADKVSDIKVAEDNLMVFDADSKTLYLPHQPSCSQSALKRDIWAKLS